MKRILLGLLVVPMMASAAMADFRVVVSKGKTVGHDIKSIYGRSADGIEMGWSAPGEDPKLLRDEKLMFIFAPADQFTCNKAIGDKQDLYWTSVDADGEESDDHVITLTVANEGRLLRGSNLIDGTDQGKMLELFDAMQSVGTIRFYYDDDCHDEGYTEASTSGFAESLAEFNGN